MRERPPGAVLAVRQDQLRPGGRHAGEPAHQIVLAGVSAEPAECVNRGLHADLLAEDRDRLFPVHEAAAERARGLVADDEHRRLRAAEVVAQMVQDAAPEHIPPPAMIRQGPAALARARDSSALAQVRTVSSPRRSSPDSSMALASASNISVFCP
jgi:hypothetical protein